MSNNRINAYKIMWLFVFFDLPVETKQNRKDAAVFRKNLIRNGFEMMQFSVYARPCASKEYMDVYVKRVKALMPPEGSVYMLSVTDKQYGNMYYFVSKVEKIKKGVPDQITLF